jgi:Flp pilus assembly protein TadG
MVFLTPTLLLVVLLVVEAAVVFHGAHIARAAAEDGAAAARAYGGSVAAGETEARDTLAQLGASLLDDVAVSAERGPQQARVVVTARVRGVLPGVHIPVRAVSSGPLETFKAAHAQGGP